MSIPSFSASRAIYLRTYMIDDSQLRRPARRIARKEWEAYLLVWRQVQCELPIGISLIRLSAGLEQSHGGIPWHLELVVLLPGSTWHAKC